MHQCPARPVRRGGFFYVRDLPEDPVMTNQPIAIDADVNIREEVERILQRLIQREEAAVLLRRSISHIDRLVAQGEMPQPIRIGPRCLMYPRSEVEAYAAQREAAKAERAATAKARRQAAAAEKKTTRAQVSA
jgi:predicted DNA-binding transcriptional regulator AlpA